MYQLYELKELIIKLEDYKEKYISEVKDFSTLTESEINIDILSEKLISIPQKTYMKNSSLINQLEETQELQKQKTIIEDNTLSEVNRLEELKNQSQRDAKLRMLLLDNEQYQAIEKILLQLQKNKMLINAQITSYEGSLSGIKLRYKQMCNLLENDKKLQEAIGNE